MKEEALALVAQIEDPGRKLNLLREYVQAFALRSLHESEAFRSIAFVGGTALRFLENIPRFSEDLDFSVTDHGLYAPQSWLKKMKNHFRLAGYSASFQWKERKTVHVAWIRIGLLMKEARLAARPEQNLSVKLEIDSRPPAGAEIVRSVVTRHLTFVLRHHALSSLMAGKIHALLTRPYSKGRDWYDLMWYRSHRPPAKPNIELLQNALEQSQGESRFDAKDWREHLTNKLSELNVEALSDDVRSFLERPSDRNMLTRENLAALLIS